VQYFPQCFYNEDGFGEFVTYLAIQKPQADFPDNTAVRANRQKG